MALAKRTDGFYEVEQVVWTTEMTAQTCLAPQAVIAKPQNSLVFCGVAEVIKTSVSSIGSFVIVSDGQRTLTRFAWAARTRDIEDARRAINASPRTRELAERFYHAKRSAYPPGFLGAI